MASLVLYAISAQLRSKIESLNDHLTAILYTNIKRKEAVILYPPRDDYFCKFLKVIKVRLSLKYLKLIIFLKNVHPSISVLCLPCKSRLRF